MKHILTTTILAATAFVALADDRSIPEKARDTAANVVEKTEGIARHTKNVVLSVAHHAGRVTRDAWEKNKAYESDDTAIYHEGANATLAGLAREIAEVKVETPNAAPAYFRTRLAALDEQHKHLAQQLAQLSPEQFKDRSAGPRHDFDRCLADLEEAIDQAKDGAATLSAVARK